MMEVPITDVYPNYVDTAIGPPGERSQVLSTFDVGLTLVRADGLTFEQACDYLRDKTRFTLTEKVE